MNGLQEFPLMVAHSGVVDFLDKLGVFIDEPRLPQYICRCVFYLRRNIIAYLIVYKSDLCHIFVSVTQSDTLVHTFS